MLNIIDEVGLSFDDVLLVPRKGSILSRFSHEIDTSVELLPKMKLKFPIISANMDRVTGVQMAQEMTRLGGLGIIHRFLPTQDHREQLKLLGPKTRVGCVGTGGNAILRLDILKDHCDHVLIDVAHGHCNQVLEMIDQAKMRNLNIIAGNVATKNAAYELAKRGADCIKVGVGPGSLCTTRIKTGCGVPQITAIEQAREGVEMASKPIDGPKQRRSRVIADGGIRNSGDIVKALAAGADAVMVGSLFAGTDESPGEQFQQANGSLVKQYRGMASRDAQMSWKKSVTSVEGEVKLVHYKGKVENIFRDIVSGILSGMSYQDARSIKELQENAVFIRQTSAGSIESTPHGLGT